MSTAYKILPLAVNFLTRLLGVIYNSIKKRVSISLQSRHTQVEESGQSSCPQSLNGIIVYLIAFSPPPTFLLVQPLFFSLAPRVECLQRVHLSVPSPNNLLPSSALDKFPAPWLRHVQTDKANVFRFPTAGQQVVWDMLQMRLYACGVVECLVVTQVGKCLWILLKLWSC
jgi:hypothetical protein